ncbi:carboxylesterase/lipase family protein [Kitasatospora sp. NPDC048365]|uniref:carboxylesterase/lipase family protein n=1 Tax=Kitasatospora sp. NPDC048365 TaxID=3364050 RepID=UPI00371D23AB
MQPIVRTTGGEVRATPAAHGTHLFRNIPYAAPPVGPLRFAPPQPAAAWDGVRESDAWGAGAPQAPYAPPLDTLLGEHVVTGQDCLNLNVWTPGTGGRLPVLVWVHGGAFTNGAGSLPMYDGAAFARDGVVLVTFNYRLGADGFLHLPGTVANRGLLDQVAALTWVRENIARFGGDPDRVTLFGQSAGAMAIACLMAMDRARGLFHRAALQSGAAQHTLTPPSAELVLTRLAEVLGVAPSVAGISAVPTDVVVKAQQRLRTEVAAHPDPARWGEAALNMMPFEPVVDGEVLPVDPLEAVRSGASAGIDLLVGTTTEEFRLFLVPTGLIDLLPEAAPAVTAQRYGLPQEALAAYRAALPDGSAGDLAAAVATDWFYRIPALRLAEAHNGNAHVYEFGWRSPAYDGTLGACHAVEVPFVFDTLREAGTDLLLGERPPQPLADTLHRAWTAFATDGDPGWPAYEPGTRATMCFGERSAVEHDPRPELRELWDGVR